LEQSATSILAEAGVLYYQNQGTVHQPHFVESSQHNTLIAQINKKSLRSLTFEDIDRDQDLDAIIGDNDHVVSYYQNTGNHNGQPIFVKQRTEQDNALAQVFSDYPSLVDIDNDGDKDAFSSQGNLDYYQNISLVSRTLPNPYALPRASLYNRPLQVSLNGVDCQTIYYRLDSVHLASKNSQLEGTEYTALITTIR
jgi:hypothetical protein